MGLETGTYISDLDANNPVGATDKKLDGDNHIRLVKSTILNSFPNITGAMTATHLEVSATTGMLGTAEAGNALLFGGNLGVTNGEIDDEFGRLRGYRAVVVGGNMAGQLSEVFTIPDSAIGVKFLFKDIVVDDPFDQMIITTQLGAEYKGGTSQITPAGDASYQFWSNSAAITTVSGGTSQWYGAVDMFKFDNNEWTVTGNVGARNSTNGVCTSTGIITTGLSVGTVTFSTDGNQPFPSGFIVMYVYE
jgi:hypothetical protein